MHFLLLFILPTLVHAADAKETPAAEATRISKLLRVPDNERGIIQLPVRFYIIKDIEMVQKGVKMSTWVTASDIEKKILPEINRIYKQAGIQWVLEGIVEQSARDIEDRDKGIETILSASRDEDGKSDPARVPYVQSFCDRQNRHKVINCVYLFPYLGQTSQGFASMGGNDAYIGVWTDKPTQAEKPPQKGLLVERGAFKIGSIARTCGHELGHNLMLSHPSKDTRPVIEALMGGNKHGYDMTSEEILLARKTATARGEKILNWAKAAGGK